MGITQFSAFPRLRIALNTHGNRDTIKTTTDSQHWSSTKLCPGKYVVLPERGSHIQQGVPQLVLLLKYAMTVWKNLQQLMGVLIQAAGSKAAHKQRLKQIAFPDSIVFMTKDFRLLLGKHPKILHALSYLAP